MTTKCNYTITILNYSFESTTGGDNIWGNRIPINEDDHTWLQKNDIVI